jgi:N-glycosylase/DNA lyase
VVDEEVENEIAGAKASAPSAWGSHNATEWVGVIRVQSDLSIVIAIREVPNTTLFRPLSPYPSDLDLKSILWEYFQLNDSLVELYDSWSKADARVATIARCIPGVRILDQDPFECLVSFICSSNNNIPRITKMVDAIRREYGEPLLSEADGSPETLYSFPSVDTMLQYATDEGLRQKCGLGYRSKYVMETLQTLKEKGGEAYLQELRGISDPSEVQAKLCEFCGVGRKVADCAALFSLRQEDAIPVDVHVWNIARRDYDDDGQLAQIKSLTPTTYRQVGDVFRRRFPEKPGWAHSLLFVAELPSFRPVLPSSIIQEMKDFQHEEKLRKQEAKVKKEKTKS